MPTETDRVYSGTLIADLNDMCTRAGQTEEDEPLFAKEPVKPPQDEGDEFTLIAIAMRITFVVLASAAFTLLALCALGGRP